MSKTIFIEVRVEEVDTMESGYAYDPKMMYELIPVDPELDGSFEMVCRKSNLPYRLRQLDKRGNVGSRGISTSQAIYGEPEEEVGTLLRDAFRKALSGFNMPALDAIVDSIEEAIMPNTVRQRNKPNRNTVEVDEE